MSSADRIALLAAAALFAGVPAASPALERAARPAPDAPDRWTRGNTCTVAYYNVCTGWIWTWTNWAPGDRVGVTFPTHCAGESGSLVANWIYVPQGAPPGYGFTGSIDVYATDASGCPVGSPRASQPFLPVTGWNAFGWYLYDVGRFAVAVELGPAPGSPVGLASDHPAVSPNGPAACGTCYPVTRVTRSFHWGQAASPLCPGSPLFDGFCNAELLLDVSLVGGVFPVEPASWGRLKSLYR